MKKTVNRTISISPELDIAIANLAAENNMSYSRYVDSRLQHNENIRNMILRIEKIPEMPVLDIAKLKQLQVEEEIPAS